MRFGIMMRGQFPAGEPVAERFQEMLAQARLAEELGFDSLAKGSHYSSHPLRDMQQIPFLARVAAEAPSLRLITGVLLLPLHKPLDVAEQVGTLDIITGGKAIFGCGVGYRDVEFAAFGTRRGERGRRFLIGSAEEVAEQMLAFQRRLGVNHIVMSLHWPGLDIAHSMEAMRLLAEKVMPLVRQGG